MRLVATSDTHFRFRKEQIPEGDVFLHAGDAMYTGLEREWDGVLESFATLDHKHKYYVPGNHDYYTGIYTGLASAQLRKEAKVRMLGTHPDRIIEKLPNGMSIMGVPYVTGLPGWAYNVEEEWLEKWLMEICPAHAPEVMVTHAPPYMILDAIRPDEKDVRQQEHVGSLSLARWFHGLETRPKYWFCGHIHESYGMDIVDGCNFYNVAMCDRSYEQTQAPMVVDVHDKKDK